MKNVGSRSYLTGFLRYSSEEWLVRLGFFEGAKKEEYVQLSAVPVCVQLLEQLMEPVQLSVFKCFEHQRSGLWGDTHATHSL